MQKQENDNLIKQKVANACQILYSQGHNDYIWGHVSARKPNEDCFWMKPRGLGLNEVNKEDLVLLDYEGNKIGGSPRRDRHSEFPIHSEIYRKRKDVNCIIHTHPFYATLISALGKPIQAITHDGCLFAKSQVFFNETSDLIRTKEMGESIANSLKNNIALFMRNHGVVVVGKNVEEAVGAAIFLERASKYQVIAMCIGNFATSTDEEINNRLEQHFRVNNYQSLFSYLERMIK